MHIRQWTAQDREEIEALAAVCRQHEPGVDLPLYLPARPATGTTETLVCHVDGVLVGVANLTHYDQVEVLGMVHPAYRRRGVGRALLDAVRRTCQRWGTSSLLLVCEEAAPSGRAFAEAVGGTHRFAEHRMQLDRAVFTQCQRPSKELVVAPASVQDVDAMVALRTASSELAETEARREVAQQLARDDETWYLGRLRGEPVGMLRVQFFEPSVFVVSFSVHPAHRRRGYGRQILGDVVERLIAEGREEIMLEVATDNEAALSLYRSCGFGKVATYLYYDVAW